MNSNWLVTSSSASSSAPLPRDTIDIELTLRTVQGIHTFQKDHTVETAICSPWSRWRKLFTSLQKKTEAYEEEKKEERSLFHPNPNQFTKRSSFSKRPRKNMQKKGKFKISRLDMAKFAPPKAERPANFLTLLPSTKSMETSTTTTTSIGGPRVSDTTTTMPSTCRTCKRWGLPCPFCAQSAPDPSPVESDWYDKDWNGEKQRAKEEEKRK